MNRFFQLTLVALFFGLTLSFTTTAQASTGKVKIDSSQYRCAEVADILGKYRNIWVKGFWGTYGNVAATAAEVSHCDGPRYGPRRCNYWTPGLKTQDGTCKVGVRCTCFSNDRGRDN